MCVCVLLSLCPLLTVCGCGPCGTLSKLLIISGMLATLFSHTQYIAQYNSIRRVVNPFLMFHYVIIYVATWPGLCFDDDRSTPPPPPPPHTHTRTHMQDLKDYTQDVHYENFRKKKLIQASPGYGHTHTHTSYHCSSLPHCSRGAQDFADLGGSPEPQGLIKQKEQEVCVFRDDYT